MANDAQVKTFEDFLRLELKRISSEYLKYHKGTYLTLSYVNGEWLYSNRYWEDDKDFPINNTVK